MTTEKTQGVLGDARIDKLATWALQLAMTVALSIGGWFLNDMAQSMRTLEKNVAVLQVDAARAAALELRVHALEASVAPLRAEVQSLKERIREGR